MNKIPKYQIFQFSQFKIRIEKLLNINKSNVVHKTIN
jgi:hypothetical protein